MDSNVIVVLSNLVSALRIIAIVLAIVCMVKYLKK
ncbi:hypothetical protein SDC9_78441 [bioreactor metagenome]|uniref:Uncharacterized protein n=1 Tax=bioreactor metagenome TaxID=1076179 RepID=A0A644Z112_9ZZZZ